MNRLLGPIIMVVLLVVGVWYVMQPQKRPLGSQGAGQQVASTQTAPIGSLSAEHEGQTVRIEGTIIKECPHSGCWAVVKDDTGEVRIDTNKGGFALPLNREGARITVVGDVELKLNGDLQINALSAEL